MKKEQNKKSLKKKLKPYRKPELISEKVFATDTFGACTVTSVAQGCGRGPYQSS